MQGFSDLPHHVDEVVWTTGGSVTAPGEGKKMDRDERSKWTGEKIQRTSLEYTWACGFWTAVF